MTLTEEIVTARNQCAAALESDELAGAAAALRRSGRELASAKLLIRSVTEVAATQQPVVRLKQSLEPLGVVPDSTALERLLLLHCALDALERLEQEPLAADVKRLICHEFQQYAAPRDARAKAFIAGQNAFQASCKIATLRRFPAGQFDWEISGIPRSWFLKLRGLDALRLPAYVLMRMRGRGPAFFRHFGVRRPLMLTEAAANASYLRMADSMRLQPEIRGFVGSGWLSSPDTIRASPHLAWVNRTICEHGGLVVRLGPADIHHGVLARSPERRRLYERGEFKPTVGMVAWDRASMLAWADEQAPRPGSDAAPAPRSGVHM